MILSYIVLNLALMAVLIRARSVLVQFLKTFSSIESDLVLSDFKNVARWNMYGALAFLICGGAALIWGIFLFQWYGLLGTIIVLMLSVPSLLISLSLKKLEVQSRNLPCNDPVLKKEYEKVSEAWVKKALPNF